MPPIVQSIAVVAAMAMALVGSSHDAVAAARSKTLIFEGTVTSIGQIADDLTPWRVTVTVDKVLSGEFSEPTFSFAVHSPVMSGLEMGHSYTVKAVWKGRGYVVDPLQWRRRGETGKHMRWWMPANKVLQTDDHLGRFAPSAARR